MIARLLQYRGAAFAACLFLIVLGAKWGTFNRYGSPMPDWDQWDAEAVELLIPWYAKDNFLSHLFHPHNEHRVILTKLQNLALTLANGQWDSRVEAVTNAMLHSALAMGFWLLARRWTRPGWHAPLFVLAAVLFGLPVAWQNVLGGFHSQQYWLLGLSFLTLTLLPYARAWRGTWWIAAGAAWLALGSMGSGFVAAGAALGVLLWRWWQRETTLRAAWPAAFVCVVAVAVGLATRLEVPWHADIKAKSVADFTLSIARSLEWPWRHHTWAGAILWLPWLLVACRLARSAPAWLRRPATAVADPTGERRIAQTLVALGGWVLIQIVATAYARGAGAQYPASRYMDTLVFGAMTNGVALAWLWDAARPAAGWRRHAFPVFVAAWVLTFALGARQLLTDIVPIELPGVREYYVKAEANMRLYLASDNRKALDSPDVPYPSVDGLIERLGNPHLRKLMPVPIRAPLALQPAAAQPEGLFRENDARFAPADRPPRLGLSPATAPLDSMKTWGSHRPAAAEMPATGEWRSQPLRATMPGWLKFETAGQLGNPNGGLALELRSAASDALLATVRPTKVPDDTWRAAYVRTPQEPFVVVARDEHAARWLAFSGPVEMGRLSYWAWRAAKNGFFLCTSAAVATVALALAGLWLDRRQPRGAPAATGGAHG